MMPKKEYDDFRFKHLLLFAGDDACIYHDVIMEGPCCAFRYLRSLPVNHHHRQDAAAWLRGFVSAGNLALAQKAGFQLVSAGPDVDAWGIADMVLEEEQDKEQENLSLDGVKKGEKGLA
jgi:hypothetical protein